jgi:hypothetical protein
MAILHHNGRDYLVERDHAVSKSGLIGFSIDGVHRGNVRVYRDHYRIGLGDTAEPRLITTPLDDVLRDAAKLYLDRYQEKRAVHRNGSEPVAHPRQEERLGPFRRMIAALLRLVGR